MADPNGYGVWPAVWQSDRDPLLAESQSRAMRVSAMGFVCDSFVLGPARRGVLALSRARFCTSARNRERETVIERVVQMGTYHPYSNYIPRAD